MKVFARMSARIVVGPELLDAYTAHGKTLSATQLARDLFSIMDSSIHSTVTSAISILLDLLEHPDSVDEIRAEIQRVKETLSGEPWSRAALGELRILDSFMSESARVHGLNDYAAVKRVPTTTWTFKDGLEIPAGTTFAFPSFQHNLDPSVNPDPGVFDAKRYLRKREELGNTHKYHFASIGEDSINWGAGLHACPGRFFAQETLKLMLIHLLTKYDIKHDGAFGDTPKYLKYNLYIFPNPALSLLLKERKTNL
ncbi:hypothetical protein KJ359_002705 [Pestalotiopsis sp. 9143b]|nr:hypothetical protein KJ359_002705 [Pestalotiopsis sp. 9143b]